MILKAMVLLPLYLAAALISGIAALPQQVSSEQERLSPCPDAFNYESVHQDGEWTGNLVIQSEDDLHGMWVRLIFDNPITKVNVEGDYEVVHNSNENQVLVKNRDIVLKAGSSRTVKITVKYEGSKFPSLIGYRLNAKTMCPDPDSSRTDVFQGDKYSSDILTAILLPASPRLGQTTYKCGLKSSTDSPTYPWVADLFVKDKGAETYACEATLISPSHLVTAAHCVTFKNDVTEVPISNLVVYLADKEFIRTGIVSKIKVHPAYDPNTLFNDVAVIELNNSLEINDNIRPICLNEVAKFDTKSTLIGYKIERSGEITNQQIETDVKRIDQSECRNKAPQLHNILGEDTYCLVYHSGNSLCAGDSGSSLVTLNDNVATLRGIVRVGVLLQNRTQCDEDSVILATSIDKHLRWIAEALN